LRGVRAGWRDQANRLKKLPDCAGFSSACKARKGAHSPGYVTLCATRQAGEKTNKVVTFLRESASYREAVF
jgi:hypothetical protein